MYCPLRVLSPPRPPRPRRLIPPGFPPRRAPPSGSAPRRGEGLGSPTGGWGRGSQAAGGEDPRIHGRIRPPLALAACPRPDYPTSRASPRVRQENHHVPSRQPISLDLPRHTATVRHSAPPPPMSRHIAARHNAIAAASCGMPVRLLHRLARRTVPIAASRPARLPSPHRWGARWHARGATRESCAFPLCPPRQH
jgi:hypothetical protein